MQMFLHGMGAILVAMGGLFAGKHFCNRLKIRLICLQQICHLIAYISEEIHCRKTDLEQLYGQLCGSNEFSVLKLDTGTNIRHLVAPTVLTADEAFCFQECFSALGSLGAQQECLRLEQYLQKFTAYCVTAQKENDQMGRLYLKLGAGVGIMAALAVL